MIVADQTDRWQALTAELVTHLAAAHGFQEQWLLDRIVREEVPPTAAGVLLWLQNFHAGALGYPECLDPWTT